ncbi:TatD family hydrolase [Pseudomonas orientalis]|uniref:TatD family hydrolase n=1 Tax=Pseudomonas orientalis TaxID=76758 RepID=UPI0032080B8A
MELIDTHTHLDFADFDSDRPQVLAHSRQLGVRRMVVLGVYQRNWQRLWDLVVEDEGLFAAFGLHPVYLDEHRPADLLELGDWLTRLQGHRQLCAVGEIGLDYFLEHLDRARSHAAVIATLKRIHLPRGGIIHAFAGSREEAREYIKLGFKLGLGGAATWPQALRMHKVLAQLPLEAVVLETDAPDMAPAMYPGRRNSPHHLPDICSALAERMGISASRLAEASTRNACELFQW